MLSALNADAGRFTRLHAQQAHATLRRMQMVVQQAQYVATMRLRQMFRTPAFLATFLLGLLLLQPTISLIHCSDMARVPSAGPSIHSSHLFCSLSDSPARQGARALVPSFWPTLPTVGAIELVQATPQIFLIALPTWRAPSLTWSPPVPPPRALAPAA
jgi:hypothetical protein